MLEITFQQIINRNKLDKKGENSAVDVEQSSVT